MRLYDLPDGVILAQIQRSVFSPQKPGLTRQQSTTGQGIHTDGLNHAMIVNLQRGRHIRGALNQFHGKLDGTEPLCEPTVLGEGVACAFKDNTIFHYVTPGYVSEDGGAVEDRSRVVMLFHYPGHIVLDGSFNADNAQGTRKSEVQLRNG
eukprot:6392841-Pyramimonas_sp.AAC.1